MIRLRWTMLVIALAIQANACSAAPALTTPPRPSPTTARPTNTPTPTSTPSPSPMPATPSTAPSSPSPTAGDVPGLRIVWREEAEYCDMRDVVVVGGELGLVAVGDCRTDAGWQGVAWSSADGTEWKRMAESEPGFVLRSVAADPSGQSLLFAGDAEESIRAVALAADGNAGLSATELPSDLDATVVYASGFQDSLGYLIVGVGYEGSPEGPSHAQAWALAPPYDGDWLAVEPPEGARAFSDVVALDGSLVVAGVTDDFVAGSWQWDGREWGAVQPIADAEADDPGEVQLVGPSLLLADQALWVRDVAGWRLHHRFDVPGSIFSVAEMHDGLIAVGRSEEGGQPMIVFTSADGVEWKQAGHLPDYSSNLVRRVVAYSPDVVVGVGSGAVVWLGPGRAGDW